LKKKGEALKKKTKSRGAAFLSGQLKWESEGLKKEIFSGEGERRNLLEKISTNP